jgi:hypothetical protein
MMVRDAVKSIWLSEFLSSNFHSHSPTTRLFRALVLFAVVAKLCREIWWALVLTPFALLLSCFGLSGLYSLVASPAVWLLLTRACCTVWGKAVVACPMLATASHTLGLSCDAHVWQAVVKAKVVLRAGWKRVRPVFEAQSAQAAKALLRFTANGLNWLRGGSWGGGSSGGAAGGGGSGGVAGAAGSGRQKAGGSSINNLRALVASAICLVLYTSVNSVFWMLQHDASDAHHHPFGSGSGGGYYGSTNGDTATSGNGGGGGGSGTTTVPTLSRPFLFLHVPGSGGVSFRASLHADSVDLKASRFLPCYGGLKCTINTEQVG